VSDDHPLLSVLIVNFNSTPLLEECLAALEASTIANRLEVIVVDNASADFAFEPIATAHPSVIFLPQDRNTTVTGGNNLAFEQATADLVLMLNPDTKVERDALERAAAHMDARRDLVGLGAYLIGPDGHLQRYYRRLPQLADLPVLLFEPIFRSTNRGRRYLMLEDDFSGETAVPQPPGAFLLFRRAAISRSLMDPVYFNYLSDVDLCARLTAQGGIAVFEDVRCFHVGSAAGTGTKDLGARLRLYQDFAWGVRKYFARWQPSLVGMLAVRSLLVAYWIARVALTARRDWRYLLRALGVAAASVAGRPPSY
jgi:GT2 family glycosyltransferase